MPTGVVASPSPPASKPPSIQYTRSATPNSIHKAPLPPSSFPEYRLDDEDQRIETPEPVKVIRTKKKGTGKSKKRTIAPVAGSDNQN